MGTYLACGIAKTIAIEKDNYTKEEILKKLKGTIDLNIYMKPIEDERYLFLEMKKEFMEKYAVRFIEEQLKIATKNSKQDGAYKEFVEQLKDKKYDDLMEIAENSKYPEFQLIEGSVFSNDISYIADRLKIFADMIIYISDGKVFMECYYDMFRYLRNLIIKNSTNPIKTSVMVSIIG